MTAERMGAFLMGAGLLFLAGAAGILGTNLHTEEQAADHTRQVRTAFVEEILPETPLPQDTATEIQKVEIQGEEYIGLLEIPSLELSLPVGEERGIPCISRMWAGSGMSTRWRGWSRSRAMRPSVCPGTSPD